MTKTEFLCCSINDNQSTIRAIDAKFVALLVAILSPMPFIGRILAHIENFLLIDAWLFPEILCISFISAWALGIATIFKGLGAIGDPAQHIVNSDLAKGRLYAGGLFSPSFLDTLLNRSVLTSRIDLTRFVQELPQSIQEFEMELSLEVMKVAYIRDIKLVRLRWSYIYTVFAFITGICIYLLSRYFAGQ